MTSDLKTLIDLNHDYIHSVQTSDVRRFDEILADDFLCSQPDGSLIDRADFLAQTARPVTIANLTAHDVQVRIMGDVAIIHATGPNSRTFWGIEAVADLMFWPSRNLGWYVEPGYEATFPDGMTKGGMAIAVGLLIGR